MAPETSIVVPAAAAPSSGGAASRQAQVEYLRGTLLERRGAFAEALAAYEFESGSAWRELA